MWKLGNTADLDGTAARSAVGGAACGAAVSLLAAGSGTLFGLAAPAAILLVAAKRWKDRVVLLAFAAAAAAMHFAWVEYPIFAAAAAGSLVGAGYAWLERRRRSLDGLDQPPVWMFAAAVALVTLVWPIAGNAVASATAWSWTQHVVPPALIVAMAGAVVGLLAGLATAPMHLVREDDPVAEALSKCRPMLDGDLRALVHRIVDTRLRTLRLFEQSRADVRIARETRRGLDGLALAAIELADRFSSVDRVLSRTSAQHVETRLTTIREQLSGATDVAVKRDLERAVRTLEEQKAQLDRLRQGRERLMARLESELASLEKAETSLALLASGDAAISGVRLEAIGMGLGRQAAELEVEGNALQETLTAAPSEAVERMANAVRA